jgi:N-acetyl sugar amidotransferase
MSNDQYPELFKDLKIINPDDKIVYCKNCVMSNQRPRMHFNDDGICGQCLYSQYKKTEIDWDKREKELEILCDKYRSEDGSWDVIVPGSGGKDSGYTAFQLKEKYGMHPLTVTWASAIPTEIGSQNLYNFIQSGYDNILISPNGIIHRQLSKLSFVEHGENFLPFSYGQIHVPLHMAVKFNIPFVMYGENGELEYGGSLKNYNKSTMEISKSDYVQEKFAPSSNPTNPDLWESKINPSKLTLYKSPRLLDLQKLGVEMHYFSYYDIWKPEQHYEIAKNNLGFQPNLTRSEGTYTNYASLDDKTDGFHYYLMFIKFGIGRATSDAAHQIRDEVITRDEGVDLVLQYDGEYPKLYENEFLDYMKMDKNELKTIINKFRRPTVWKKENEQFYLKNQVTKL